MHCVIARQRRRANMSFYIISLLPECVCVLVSWLLSSDVCFVVATTLASSCNSSCISSSTSHVLAPPLPIPAVPGPYISQPDEKTFTSKNRRKDERRITRNRIVYWRIKINQRNGNTHQYVYLSLPNNVVKESHSKVFDINNYWLKYFTTAEIWTKDNVQ